MDPTIEAALSLILVEHEAAWPACAREHQQAFPCSVIEVQAEGEPPREFAAGVGRRVRSIVARGSRIRVAIIATNHLLDVPTRQGRRQLGQVVAQAMGLSGELVLSTVLDSHTSRPRGAERLRGELLSVAGLLCAEFAGTEIVVSVNVTEATTEGGVRPGVRGLPDRSELPRSPRSVGLPR